MPELQRWLVSLEPAPSPVASVYQSPVLLSMSSVLLPSPSTTRTSAGAAARRLDSTRVLVDHPLVPLAGHPAVHRLPASISWLRPTTHSQHRAEAKRQMWIPSLSVTSHFQVLFHCLSGNIPPPISYLYSFSTQCPAESQSPKGTWYQVDQRGLLLYHRLRVPIAQYPVGQ